MLCFVTILFLAWDILVEMQVYRQELLYGDREAKSPLEIALAEKLEAREMELINRGQIQKETDGFAGLLYPCGSIR